MITLRRSRPFGYSIAADDGRDTLVQADTDYPGVASSFGWSIADVVGHHGVSQAHRGERCMHDGTDGTIACAGCGTPALTFIDAAADWLDAHDGATADDPGYFAED